MPRMRPQGPGRSCPPTVQGLLSAGPQCGSGLGAGGPGGCGNGLEARGCGPAAESPDQRHSWDDRALASEDPMLHTASHPPTSVPSGARAMPRWPLLGVARGGTVVPHQARSQDVRAPGPDEFWEPDVVAVAVAVAPRSPAVPTSADLARLPAQGRVLTTRGSAYHPWVRRRRPAAHRASWAWPVGPGLLPLPLCSHSHFRAPAVCQARNGPRRRSSEAPVVLKGS